MYENPLNFLYFVFIPILVYFLVFGSIFKKLNIKKKEIRSIFSQDNIPDNLTPIEVGYIIKGDIPRNIIASEIIYLATEGYIKIKKAGKCHYGLNYEKKDDFEFSLLKEVDYLPSYDKEIIRQIFKKSVVRVGTVALFSKSFYMGNSGDFNVSELLFDYLDKSLTQKNYYNSFSTSKITKKNAILILSSSFVLAISSFCIYLSLIDSINLYHVVAIFLLPIISLLFYIESFTKSKTPSGSKVVQKIYNFKDFLQNMTLPIDSNLFEKYFPYAVVLGIENEWAKKFENVDIPTSDWYDGGSSKSTSEILLVNSTLNTNLV